MPVGGRFWYHCVRERCCDRRLRRPGGLSQRPPGLFVSKAMKSTPVRRRPARQSCRRTSGTSVPKNHCVFREPFTREQVDPRVKALWEKTTGQKAPFGDLRRTWQNEACARVNPYTSEFCPYRTEECAMSFLSAVQESLLPWINNPAAYFRRVARSYGARMADEKPLARERPSSNVSGERSTPNLNPKMDAGSGKVQWSALGTVLSGLTSNLAPRKPTESHGDSASDPSPTDSGSSTDATTRRA